MMMHLKDDLFLRNARILLRQTNSVTVGVKNPFTYLSLSGFCDLLRDCVRGWHSLNVFFLLMFTI